MKNIDSGKVSPMCADQTATFWLTGLSGSGKSTLAHGAEQALRRLGRPCLVLDGDSFRRAVSSDLGFSHVDRIENIRRAAGVARLVNDAGMIVIASFISPFREARQMARSIVGDDRFIEIYLSASVNECEKRDHKGLYARARAGTIADFTGISSPYEAPDNAELTIDTSQLGAEQTLEVAMIYIETRLRIGNAMTGNPC
ncbi:MAG: adenylyl-sulfate kinase [Betaproteobacteria bacterium]